MSSLTYLHRNNFIRLYQQKKSSESKVKFKEASNCYKRVLGAAKLVYVNKVKESITSQKRGSQELLRIANSVLNKGKSAIYPLLSLLCLLHSIKQKNFAKTFKGLQRKTTTVLVLFLWFIKSLKTL